jgi:outer membrane protein OmpA-like peptidoglycan-associated protein
MRGRIYNSETLQPIKARISYQHLPEETEIGYTVSDSLTGDYEIVLPVGLSYRYIVDIEGFKVLEDVINLVDLSEYAEINQDLYIDPAQLAKAYAMNALAKGGDSDTKVSEDDTKLSAIEINDGVLSITVKYNFDSDVIRKNSFPDLNRIVNLLQSTPVNIILAGHTDAVGTENYNQKLSERRAQSVYRFFVQKGIDPDKIKTIGYGEKRPRFSNDTLLGMRRNRRVEFIREDKMDAYDQKYEAN